MNPAETLRLEPLKADLARVEARLGEAVRHDDRFLDDVASHLVGAGGKRVRPMLTVCAAYAATDGSAPVSDAAVTGGVAVELVHLGSMYHDDVIGELCRGQVLELQHLFDVERSEEGYSSAIEGKTASLFAAACRIGGMVSGLGEADLDAITRYGHHVGMCFQIVDDVLDVTATEDVLGKPAGQDLMEGVYTLPVIYALSDSGPLRQLLAQPLDADRLTEARKL